MDDALLDAILERLAREPLSDASTDLLLAASQGERALDEAIGGTPVTRPGTSGLQAAAAGEPVGAYLRSITVQAFRGIGPEATLQLQPGPGLTVVVGRNGSGKSTFAEGLEVLLTGDAERFARLTAFRAGWRNLHGPAPTRVAAALHVAEHAGTTTVERAWTDGADLENGTATVQFPGEPREPLDRLGWQPALALYRPFLAHSELEAMFGRPSELYDRLSQVLGLDDLIAVQGRLGERRRKLEQAGKEATATKRLLLRDLGELDDTRAAACHAALNVRTVDFAAIETVITGTSAVERDTPVDRLRSLANLASPAADSVGEAVAALEQAAAALEQVTETDAEQARHLAGLLAAALDHHDRHPDEATCPVCGRADALDESWRVATEAAVDGLRGEAADAEAARRAVATAQRAAMSLVSAPPAVVTAEASDDLGIDLAPVRSAWQTWATVPTASEDAGSLRALAEHLTAHAGPLAEQTATLAAAAQDELGRREDLWAPLAVRVAAWVETGKQAASHEPTIKAIKAAEKWLKDAHDDLRNERLRPIAEQAQAVWAQLRHESNVDLGAIRLTGSATRRHVELAVEVDGTPGAALGVMSQGEVNALALSVFLPRATMPESPFRFVVIDDPVQAMDPAKVDGLARVLEGAAATRQVIVFTHDDRLPAAIRRLGIGARILQVHRRPGSFVEITAAGDPASQALRDARAVANDEKAPPEVVARVVPGLCRIGLEAALTEAAQRRLLAGGHAHDEVDEALTNATRLTQKAALALFGEADRGGDVLGRLNRLGRRHADTFQALNRGAHGELVGTPKDTVGDAERLVEAIVEAAA